MLTSTGHLPEHHSAGCWEGINKAGAPHGQVRGRGRIKVHLVQRSLGSSRCAWGWGWEPEEASSTSKLKHEEESQFAKWTNTGKGWTCSPADSCPPDLLLASCITLDFQKSVQFPTKGWLSLPASARVNIEKCPAQWLHYCARLHVSKQWIHSPHPPYLALCKWASGGWGKTQALGRREWIGGLSGHSSLCRGHRDVDGTAWCQSRHQ